MKRTKCTRLSIVWLLLTATFNLVSAQEYPDNPWGEQWEHIYDGLDRTERLLIKNKRNVLIIGSTFQNISERFAIELEHSENVLVIGNTVRDHIHQGHGSGVGIGYGCKNIIVEDNLIFNVTGNGISTKGSSKVCCPHDNPVPGCIIRGNVIHDTGLWPDTAGNSPKHGMYVKAQEALIENNTVYNCYDGQGLSIRSTGIVRGNKVWNTRSWPFAYWPQKEGGSSETLIIENNVFYQDGAYEGPLASSGIMIISQSDGFKFDNFIIRFNTLVRFPDAVHERPMMHMATELYTNVQVYGNLLVDMRPEGPKYFRGQDETSYFEKNYTSTIDEGFADMDNRDFHLTSSHPAKHFATGVKEFPTDDRDGNVRNSAFLDAGAYQFVEPGMKYDVSLTIDPYEKNDFFQFRIENNSTLASVKKVEITALGGAEFDLFENGKSYTVSPDPEINADDISYSQLDLNFTGDGLIAGEVDQNSNTGWKSDWDGKITGFEAI